LNDDIKATEPVGLSHPGTAGQQPQDGEELLTIDEAGKFLDTSKSTIYRLLGQGDLKGTKVGKQWRFRKSDLTAYLERGPEAISMDAAARAELDALAASIGDSPAELERASEDAKVIRVAHYIIQEAIRAGASDIHIEPGQSTLRVRFRIDGVLTEAMSIPKSLQETLTARLKIMTDLNIMEKRAPQDGRMPVRTDGKDYDLRISCVPTYYGESIVMRILDRSSVLIGVDKLGFSESEQRTIDRWLHRSSGIVITTGPTGS
jgi:excisionase family DNA binding protein